MTRASELGYSIKIVEDGSPNALLYDGANMRVNGDKCFRPLINELFELKKKYGNEYDIFKRLINVLWGALCERVKKKYFFKADKVFINEPMVVTKWMDIGPDPFSPTNTVVHGRPIVHRFNSDYARLGPFLLAKARSELSQAIEPHLKYIKRVHTDGFLSKKKLDIKTGSNLGDLKYKGYCENVYVKNVNNVIDTATGEKYTDSLTY